jgi:hypothetical protein
MTVAPRENLVSGVLGFVAEFKIHFHGTLDPRLSAQFIDNFSCFDSHLQRIDSSSESNNEIGVKYVTRKQ